MVIRFYCLFSILTGVLLTGCTTINSQISGRTATEQYLVTSSIERAVDRVRWDRLRGQKVFLEIIGVQTTEIPYIQSVLENRLMEKEAHPVSDATSADVILTAMVKSVGTDIWSANFGIPVVFATTTATPYNLGGLSLYSKNLQEGYCRLEFYGSHPESRETIWYGGPVNGTSYFQTVSFLGVIGPFKSSDIYPEKKLIRPKDYKDSELSEY